MQNKDVNWRWVSIGAIGFFLIMGFAGNADYEDALLAERAYCENVERYIQTNGKEGWPDYNENFDEICVKYSNG